jgi:hypothetical protein
VGAASGALVHEKLALSLSNAQSAKCHPNGDLAILDLPCPGLDFLPEQPWACQIKCAGKGCKNAHDLCARLKNEAQVPPPLSPSSTSSTSPPLSPLIPLLLPTSPSPPSPCPL